MLLNLTWRTASATGANRKSLITKGFPVRMACQHFNAKQNMKTSKPRRSTRLRLPIKAAKRLNKLCPGLAQLSEELAIVAPLCIEHAMREGAWIRAIHSRLLDFLVCSRSAAVQHKGMAQTLRGQAESLLKDLVSWSWSVFTSLGFEPASC